MQIIKSTGFSRSICVVCNFQLKEFYVFKRNILSLQKGLFKFVVARQKSFEIKLEQDYLSVKTEVEENEYQENSNFVEPEIEIDDNEENESEFLDFNKELNFGEFTIL